MYGVAENVSELAWRAVIRSSRLATVCTEREHERRVLDECDELVREGRDHAPHGLRDTTWIIETAYGMPRLRAASICPRSTLWIPARKISAMYAELLIVSPMIEGRYRLQLDPDVRETEIDEQQHHQERQAADNVNVRGRRDPKPPALRDGERRDDEPDARCRTPPTWPRT